MDGAKDLFEQKVRNGDDDETSSHDNLVHRVVSVKCLQRIVTLLIPCSSTAP